MRSWRVCLLVATLGCGPAPPAATTETTPGAAAERDGARGADEPPREERVVRWQRVHAESFERGAHPSVEAGCGPRVAAVARALRLDDVTSCRVEAYASGAERLLVVTLDYGPVQDCPSGCFHENASAIVRGDRIVAVPTPRVALESPYGFVRRFIEQELTRRSLPISNPNGVGYEFFMPEGWCANYHDRVAPETRGDEVRWVIDIPVTRCDVRLPGPGGAGPGFSVELEGAIVIPIVPAEGGYPAPDFGELRLSVDGA